MRRKLDTRGLDHFLLEDTCWIASRDVDVGAYDFEFQAWFDCKRPYLRPDSATTFLRVGAVANYPSAFSEFLKIGIRPINSPDEHARSSELPVWYPLIKDLTPRSVWFDELPSSEEVGDLVGWPAFIKGARQTNRHDSSLSVARSPGDFDAIASRWDRDPVLGWQQMVARQLVPLRAVVGTVGAKVRPSFEFRTFWLDGELVGAGRYWQGFADYDWTPAEQQAGLDVVGEAARRVTVPFLVVDLAQLVDGTWIVIECNDAQESGYLGVDPHKLWRKVADSYLTRG